MSVQSPQPPNKAKGGSPRPEEAQGPAYDPFGIYGTRSAQRILAARRRRVVQKFAVAAAVVALIGICVGMIFVPPVSLIKGDQLGVVSVPSAVPVAASDKEGNVLLLPGEGGELLRFDPQKGTVVSCLNTDFPLRASPVVQGSVAFVPSENGVLTALDWRRGKILWQRATNAPLTARPAAVQWQTTEQQELAVATLPAPVAAVDNPVNNAATATPIAAPAPRTHLVRKTHKMIVAGNDGGFVVGLEMGTGKVIWSRRIGAPIGNGIVAVPTTEQYKTPRVLVPLLQSAGLAGGLWCLDAITGVVLWKYPRNNHTPSPQVAPPALDIEKGHVFCADDTGTLSCLDLKTGQKIWKKFAFSRNPHANEIVLLRGEPLFRRYKFGEVVVLGGSDGMVRCFTANDGTLLWQFDAGAPVRARPLPLLQNQSDSSTRELLLIGCDSALLPVLDPESGHSICNLRASAAAPFGVAPVGEQLCTVTTTGVVEEFVF